MKIGLITFLSALHDERRIENSHYCFISELKNEFDVSFINPDEAQFVDLPLVFIASGGTEEMVKNAYDNLPKPLILLTDGMHNSLAASLEILAWANRLGKESEILHGDIKHIKKRIHELHTLKSVKNEISKASIGLIGFPSSWLIASDVDYISAKKRWGVNFKNIELEKLFNLIDQIDKSYGKEYADNFMRDAAKIVGVRQDDVLQASRVYMALKALCNEMNVNAVTLKCFDLISKFNTTGCMAVSILNNEDIVAACEGDCPSAFSMLLIKLLTGNKSFMANPANIDKSKNEIILAHCSVPTDITQDYIIKTHFESRKGVGIQGKIEEGDVTVFKCGGSGLDKYFLSSGVLTENLDEENMCRTQVKIKLHEDINYFFKNPLANHHIIVKGNHVDIINEFMRSMGCERVR